MTASRLAWCVLSLVALTTTADSAAAGSPSTEQAPALTLEASIPLEKVSGRIDHLAVDVARQRLYVAELGNNRLGVIDLKASAVLQTVSGLDEPQGVGYASKADEIFVANGGEGSVRRYNSDTLAPKGQSKVGSDAGNIRVDAEGRLVMVGHSSGALTVLDAVLQKPSRTIALKAIPKASH